MGLGWIVLERVKPWRAVAMGHVYQGVEGVTDGKDSSREELRALAWPMYHLWHVRTGAHLADVNPLREWERIRLNNMILIGLRGPEDPGE